MATKIKSEAWTTLTARRVSSTATAAKNTMGEEVSLPSTHNLHATIVPHGAGANGRPGAKYVIHVFGARENRHHRSKRLSTSQKLQKSKLTTVTSVTTTLSRCHPAREAHTVLQLQNITRAESWCAHDRGDAVGVSPTPWLES